MIFGYKVVDDNVVKIDIFIFLRLNKLYQAFSEYRVNIVNFCPIFS